MFLLAEFFTAYIKSLAGISFHPSSCLWVSQRHPPLRHLVLDEALTNISGLVQVPLALLPNEPLRKRPNETGP